MMYKAHSKYAAVGRKEMNIWFSFYVVICVFQIITLGNFVSVNALEILSSIHIGFIVGFFWVLALNGLVGYQFVEDGGYVSFLGILFSGLVITGLLTLLSLDVPYGILNGAVSHGTYSGVLFGLYLIFPLILAVLYVVLMTVLILKNLGEHKPLINLFVAVVFFVGSIIFTFVVNADICNSSKKAIDGTIFASICNLTAVIFIYRFWDSITEDDWDNVDDIFV